MSALREDAAAAFLVEDAGVSLAGLEVGLVAGDNRAKLALFDDLAAVLDAGVAIDDPVGKAQFEIAHFAACIDEKGVMGQFGVRFGDAGDGAVLDGPEIRAALPAGEIFSVEQ